MKIKMNHYVVSVSQMKKMFAIATVLASFAAATSAQAQSADAGAGAKIIAPLEIENLTGQGEKELSTADERIERKPPSSLQVDLMEGSPMDLGFSIFNGDFVHISYIRAPEVAP
jgi:hypothetical protein